MRQQQTFRGFMFIFLISILAVTAMRFLYVRQANKVTNQDLVKILENSQAADVNIHQNLQTPTGEVILTLLDGQVKRLYVLNVKNVQRSLDAHNMTHTIMGVPQENYLVTIILPFMLPTVVVVIIIMIMDQSTGDGGTNTRMMNSDKSRTKVNRDGKVNLFNVAGLAEEKEELEEMVDFFKSPRKYTSVGVRILKDLLLVGPPGTGKTLLAKAVAGEVGIPFFSISGSDFMEMFVGVGASRVRDLSEETEKNSPCIVFTDETDAVAHRRGTGMGDGHDEREQTLNQLLVEMDGSGVNEGIIVVTATNYVGILDPAVLRPGHFGRRVAVGRPDVKGREEVLKVHPKGKSLSGDMDLHRVAQTILGLMGADLENLVSKAAVISARDNRRFIKQNNIDRALVKVGTDTEKKSKIISRKDKKITAYHEAGHAILPHVLPDARPVHTVSIIPTGIGTAGYTIPLPEKDETLNTKGCVMQNIVMDLDGRTAEELILDDITTGAPQDIKQIAQIARAMVTQCGISRKVGMIQYGGGENEVFIGRNLAYIKSYGSEVADTIDSEVERIINECYQKAKDIIKQYGYILRACAALLIEREEVNQFKFGTLSIPAQ